MPVSLYTVDVCLHNLQLNFYSVLPWNSLPSFNKPIRLVNLIGSIKSQKVPMQWKLMVFAALDEMMNRVSQKKKAKIMLLTILRRKLAFIGIVQKSDHVHTGRDTQKEF